MKKALALTLAAIALAVGLCIHKADARLTGTNPGTDVWCMGVRSYEVCVDSSGNIIPTTNNNQTAGTSALRFSNVYSVLGNYSGALTAASLSLSSGLTAANIGDGQVTSGKIALVSSANAALCVKSSNGALGICGSAVGSNGGCTCN